MKTSHLARVGLVQTARIPLRISSLQGGDDPMKPLSLAIETSHGTSKFPFWLPTKPFKITFYIRFVHGHVPHHTRANMAAVWQSADTFRESVFSFHQVCLRHWPQVFSFGGKDLCPLSHLPGPAESILALIHTFTFGSRESESHSQIYLKIFHYERIGLTFRALVSFSFLIRAIHSPVLFT